MLTHVIQYAVMDSIFNSALKIIACPSAIKSLGNFTLFENKSELT